KGKRQQFHQRIAEVLEAQFPETVQTRPELLAHHFTEAGLTEQAISYWLKAGVRSLERSANVEAIGHLTTGLALLGKLEESPDRDAQELQLLNPLGTAYQLALGYAVPEAGRVLRRARTLCDRIGQPVQRFSAMFGQWAWHVSRGDLRLCMELADEAMEFAERVADPGMKMEALFLAGPDEGLPRRLCRGPRVLRAGAGQLRRPTAHGDKGHRHPRQFPSHSTPA